MRYSGRKSEIISFLIRFAIWTALLGFLWQIWLCGLYLDFLKPIAFAFLRVVGVKKLLYTRVADQFVNMLAYLSLVLASPNAIRRWRLTIVAAISGIVFLIAEHVLLTWAIYEIEQAYPEPTMRDMFVIPMWIVSAALPFILWTAFYPDIVTRVMVLGNKR